MTKRILMVGIILVFAVSMLASCGTTPSTQTVGDLVDMSGEAVTLTAVPEKIVSLTPAGTETVFAMGMGDKLVGIDAFSNYPEETKNIAVVGDFNGPDIEKIISLEPDVVFAAVGLQKDSVENLKKMGIPVVVVEASKYEDIPTAINLMGTILNKSTEAGKIIEEIKKAEEVAKSSAPKESKRVYYAMSYGDMGNWTSGQGSFINTIIEIAGGTPITKDIEFMWVEYQMEDLLKADPQIVLLASDGGELAGLKNALGYKDLDAVKEGRAYQIDADVLSRPGPRIADAIKMISDIINK